MTRDFPSMFEKNIRSFFGKEFDDYLNRELVPLSHTTESDTKFVIEIDLPFVEKKNITVDISVNHLVIKAKLEETFCISKLSCITEFNYFKKTFHLTQGIDTKKITAKFVNGILSITLPKITTGRKLRID